MSGFHSGTKFERSMKEWRDHIIEERRDAKMAGKIGTLRALVLIDEDYVTMVIGDTQFMVRGRLANGLRHMLSRQKAEK